MIPLCLAGLLATELSLVLVYALRLKRASSSLGKPLVIALATRRRHRVLVLLLLASTLILATLMGLQSGAFGSALALLVLAFLVELATPEATDQVCAENGVRVGFFVTRYEDFESWRLTGDHLRFRLAGSAWLAVSAPAGCQADVRTRLEQLAPGRESQFQD